jgi:RNA polymerase sigma-70 factor (ECF subfamily)
MTTTAIFQKAKTEAGRIQSFEKLIAENENKIFNTIYSFIGDYEDALDLTQETFIYAFRSMRKFRQESAISTWLYTIAINVCKKSYNKKKRHASIFTDSMDDPKIAIHVDNYVSRERSAVDILEISEEQLLIRQAISSLPKKYKMVIVLKYLQDLSYEDIARIIGCNIGTVKSRLARAKERLKSKLECKMEVESRGLSEY